MSAELCLCLVSHQRETPGRRHIQRVAKPELKQTQKWHQKTFWPSPTRNEKNIYIILWSTTNMRLFCQIIRQLSVRPGKHVSVDWKRPNTSLHCSWPGKPSNNGKHLSKRPKVHVVRRAESLWYPLLNSQTRQAWSASQFWMKIGQQQWDKCSVSLKMHQTKWASTNI